MGTIVEKIELDEVRHRGRIILTSTPARLHDFSFDSLDSVATAPHKSHYSLTLVPGITAISWNGTTRELLFSWSRLFSADETLYRVTSALTQGFGLQDQEVIGSPVPKYPEETIAIQHPSGGCATFVHTRVRLCPVCINRATTQTVPLFEKLRILEGVTISLHPFVAHVIAKDERASINISNTAVANAIIREFKLQQAQLIQI